MQQQERILFYEYGTQLRVAGDDALILNVMCGRVGELGVEFPLNVQEREEYRRRGDAFIKERPRSPPIQRIGAAGIDFLVRTLLGRRPAR